MRSQYRIFICRYDIEGLQAAGKEGPKEADGYFLYIDGKEGAVTTKARFRSPTEVENLASCLSFDYSIFVSFFL